MSPCLSEEEILAFLRGQSLGPARRASEGHLAACGDCRALVSELVRQSAAGARLGAEAPLAAAPLSPAAAPVQPGDVVGGKYEVEWTIGAGGMGVVVSAVHKVLGQRVAIKFPLAKLRGESEGRARLIREARACAQLRSEHTVRLLDVGALEDGSPYVVMEYLEGRTLTERLAEDGPFGVADAVDSVIQACEALDEAHGKGLVHRDVKPSNLFETRRFDGSRVVKVLDFGIAKSEGTGGETPLTVTRDVLGSPAYMAPEQLRRTRDVDARADIWALGVTLRELLTGTLDEAPVQPSGLDRVVRRCLEADAARRFPSARALARALAPYGSDVARGIAARLSTEPEGRARLGSGVWLTALALATMAVVAGGAVSRVAPRAPPPASAAVANLALEPPAVPPPPSAQARGEGTQAAPGAAPRPSSVAAPRTATSAAAYAPRPVPRAPPPRSALVPQPAAPPAAADPFGLSDRK